MRARPPTTQVSILYLQFNLEDSALKEEVYNVLKSYSGTSPVFVQWNKKLYNININTGYNKNLHIELASIIGENNIKFI